MVKRGFDFTVSVVALVALAPVFFVIAILIKRDSPGPVFYRGERVGRNGTRFRVYKFRTMLAATDRRGSGIAVQDGPRITRLGRRLRRSKLDELPQLLNVVRGEMSLVGPRPHAVAHNRYFAGIIDDYLGRHRVKPGITGWAQVNGLRGETTTAEQMRLRVQYDLYYIDHWSL